MRVLYLNPDGGIPVLGSKGASVHVRQFIAALAAEGHEVLLIASRAGEGNPAPCRLIELPANPAAAEAEAHERGLSASQLEDRVLRRELVRLAHDRRLAARVAEALGAARFRPDVVYERHALFHRSGVEIAQALATPRLVEVNAPLILEQERFRGLRLKAEAVSAERVSFAGADRIVSVSDEVAVHVRGAGVEPDRIQVAPNGVDTDLFRPDLGGGAQVRAALGLGDAPVIGFIGSFKAWHGVGFLVDAFAQMARRRPDLRLLAVGDGPERAAAEARLAGQGLAKRAVFTGAIPHAEVPAHLAAMDLSVAPYTPEADFYFSPMKAVESLSAGVPVVAARAGQLVALIEHGRTGLLFAPGDRGGFNDAVLRLVDDEPARKAMGRNARARALAGFSWRALAAGVMDEAARLMGARRAA